VCTGLTGAGAKLASHAEFSLHSTPYRLEILGDRRELDLKFCLQRSPWLKEITW
jgi:hypothetical protein